METPVEDPDMNPASEMLDGSSSAARDEAVLEAKHKVFLSHSGAQKDFVEQLCEDLERHDRYPFFDKRRDSLPIGQHFPNVIFEAIRQCQVGVLILSQEFFTRTKWPMLEFWAMVESKKRNSKLVIMPVFLGVSREECRNVENHVQWESVWLKWKQTDPRINVENWKQALSIFGPTNGLSYNKSLGEVKFRKEIVEAICERVRPETLWDDSHVQGRSRLCQVVREKVDITQVCKGYGVKVLGLYGVGGLGKTTMCKALCNDYFKEFQGKVAHVTLEIGLELELMRGVLKKLTDTKHEVLARFDKGECITHLKVKVHQHDVFLAIDNVFEETMEQARVYLRTGFTQGSVVIVTSRSMELLIGVGIATEDCVKLPELDAGEARSLFLHEVLGVPDEMNAEDEAHIIRCVKLCQFRDGDESGFRYLPMALKIFGNQLSAYDPRRWVEHIHDTSKKLMISVFTFLRRSFDALKEDDKLLFMDVVLFFPRRSFTLNNFDIDEFEWLSIVHRTSVEDMKLRLQELKRRSVIEELDERVRVHDLWRQFAEEETKVGQLECRRWMYVNGNEQNEFDEADPSGSRWGELRRMCFIHQYLANVNLIMLTKLHYCSNVTVLHLMGFMELYGVEVLDLTALKYLKSLLLESWESRVEVRGLGTLKSLGLLVWNHKYISSACMEDIGRLTSLQILKLSCQCDELPDLTNLKLLQVVEFAIGGKISKLTGLSYNLTKLRKLNVLLSTSSSTCSIYGISKLTALQELKIEGWIKVEEVFNLSNLTNLQSISIMGRQSIKTLPGLDDLAALKSFHLRGRVCECCELGALDSLPQISKLTNLQILDIIFQKSITALKGLSDAISLQELRAASCYELRELPDMGKLTNLQLLDISWCSVQALPGLGALVALQVLIARHCSELRVIPDLRKLSNLKRLDLSWCALTEVRGLDELEALEELLVGHCGELVALPELSKLRNLSSLDVRHCSSLRSLPSLEDLSRLRELKGDLQPLMKMLKLAPRLVYLKIIGWGSQGLASSASGRTLSIRDCRELDELNSLPPSVVRLKLKRCNFRAISGLLNCTALEELEIISCHELERLPDLQYLTELRIVHKEDSKSKALIKIGNLPELKNLGCRNLGITELPDLSICCPQLVSLRVSNCQELRSLTSSGPLIGLKSFTVESCGSLRALPDLRLCTLLDTLILRECGVRLTRPSSSSFRSRWPCVEWEVLP